MAKSSTEVAIEGLKRLLRYPIYKPAVCGVSEANLKSRNICLLDDAFSCYFGDFQSVFLLRN